MAASLPRLRDAEPRLVALVAVAIVGVYLLILAGATATVANAVRACPTWPACNGEWFPHLDTPRLAIALAHRLIALVVGLVLVGTTAVAWRTGAARRVTGALGGALALYPAQVAIGALTAVSGAPLWVTALHLVTAMGIFTALVLALLWQLEAETAADEALVADAPSVDAPTVDAPAGDAPAGGTATGGASSSADPHLATDDTADEPEPATPDRPAPSPLAVVRAYVSLTKPRLMWLLCLVAVAAMGLAAGGLPPVRTVFATLAGGVLAIGASGTFNHVLERDRDRKMRRTDDRPLVRDRIPARRAVAFGLALAVASVAVFLAFVNVLAAALGLLAILFYSVVYTLVLKPHTSQNIVLGGAVGAFPALIGSAAVHNEVGVTALLLGALIFLWTPAHFYNLAMAYEEDYARAGFPMLPVVRGEAVTRRHILLYLGATLLSAALLGLTAHLDWLYAVTTLALGSGFLWTVLRLYRERTHRAAFRTFTASNVFLGGVLLAILLDTLLV